MNVDLASWYDTGWQPILFVITFIIINSYVFRGSVASKWSSTDEPLLLASGLFSSRSVQSMGQGQVAGYYYNLLTDGSGRVTVLVTLNKVSGTHILAYGDKDNSVNIRPSKKWLHRVELEGDFPDYFHLYCTPDREIELLQVFEPETMAHFVDFCRAYNLEIYRDCIYVSQVAGARDKNDTTTMFTDIEHFLKENDRILQRL